MSLVSVLENSPAGRGNRWLKIQVPGQSPLDHEPGTVVGLSFRQGADAYRHAYTVSRADPEKRTLEFLYRVIPQGRMTPRMAGLSPGSEMQLAGRGGHPISGEVDPLAEGIVLASTGTGIGPLFGFSQMALARGLKLPIKLFAGFREAQDCCLREELGALAREHPNFEWHFSLSRPDAAWTGLRGHVTESMPALLGPVGNLHFHLVGNGNMVVELYEVLMALGLRDERVTSEVYFNYPEQLDPARLGLLASKFVF
ncbi:MAG TPA: FAD-dependent oxidoreductase [bacterium]|jgi:NAD(P)H-flavin reductase|nr:FAD-dependent oxidoreductase [bacterium]